MLIDNWGGARIRWKEAVFAGKLAEALEIDVEFVLGHVISGRRHGWESHSRPSGDTKARRLWTETVSAGELT